MERTSRCTRLEVARSAGGLESGALELTGDELSRAAMTLAAGVAALHVVVGQNLDVRPPARAFLGDVGGQEERRGCENKDYRAHSEIIRASTRGCGADSRFCRVCTRGDASAGVDTIVDAARMRAGPQLLRAAFEPLCQRFNFVNAHRGVPHAVWSFNLLAVRIQRAETGGI